MYYTKGENSLSTPYGPDETIVTPVGVRKKRFTVHLGGELSLMKFMSLGTHVYWSSIRNSEHMENENQRSVELSLCARLLF